MLCFDGNNSGSAAIEELHVERQYSVRKISQCYWPIPSRHTWGRFAKRSLCGTMVFDRIQTKALRPNLLISCLVVVLAGGDGRLLASPTTWTN